MRNTLIILIVVCIGFGVCAAEEPVKVTEKDLESLKPKEAQPKEPNPLDKVADEMIEAQGKSPLSQVMSTVLFGDYVSYYLAILNQVDPSPVAAIDYLKQRLGKIET